jgi:hypothetical protein
MDEDDVQRAVERGVEQGLANVVVTAGEIYLLGGCLLMALKAVGFLFLVAFVLGVATCSH